MADLPISLLPTAEGLDPADLIPIVNNGVTKKITVRTIGGTPLDLGPTVAASSVPVTVATDQLPIPVKEVNKEVTQVSLSLLGIPRSEVALGIFGDVNTYDVNPLEWTSYPQITGSEANRWGVRHLSAESAAQISCPTGFSDSGLGIQYFSRLTSKRYFRYQPGRVSSGTFGVRIDTSFENAPAGLSYETTVRDGDLDAGDSAVQVSVYNRYASTKKWGCFDNENGYYFECRGDGTGDQFLVVRRTNSIPRNPIYVKPGSNAFSPDVVPFSHPAGRPTENYAGLAGDHAIIVRDKMVLFHAALFDTTLLATSADEVAGNTAFIKLYPQWSPSERIPPTELIRFYEAHWKNFGVQTVGQTRWGQYLEDLYRCWSESPPAFQNGIRVKAQYRNVYEFRVPRSCFNFDNMNGENNLRRWSDYFDGNVVGQALQEDGQNVYVQSVKNLDFTKVTMYKIEYSWYGAVGAQFLAYVPVSNSLARWVRIHHLRVSNQIGSPSLGNPTLPFTYINIGGANKPGVQDYIQRVNKYGASYLIDGGDKGTVSVNTVATDNEKMIFPDRQAMVVSTLSANFTDIGVFDFNNPTNDSRTNFLSGVAVLTSLNAQTGNVDTQVRGLFNSFHIGARLYGTDSEGRNVYPGVAINDISHDGRLAFISENKPVGLALSSVQLTAVTGRGTPILGIRVKNTINNIRNRSQIYPTRLSFGTNKPALLQLVKNPKFASIMAATNNYQPPVGFRWYTSFVNGSAQRVNSNTYNAVWDMGGTHKVSVPPLTATVGSLQSAMSNLENLGYNIPASTEETEFSHVVYFNRYNCVVPLVSGNRDLPILGSFLGVKGILRLKSWGPDGISSEDDSNIESYEQMPLPPSLGGGNVRVWLAKFTFKRLFSGYSVTVTDSDYQRNGRGAFIPELPIRSNGTILTNTGVGAAWSEDRPLIAVEEDIYEQRSPTPATGEVLASFNVDSGGVDLDLSPYFGFDKQYLSFPLVEGGDPDMLYLTARALDGEDTTAVGGGSLTWEEQ